MGPIDNGIIPSQLIGDYPSQSSLAVPLEQETKLLDLLNTSVKELSTCKTALSMAA